MNQESFRDAEIAALINDNYIPILADREERPDLDMLYQGAAGIMRPSRRLAAEHFPDPRRRPFWVAGYLPLEEQARAAQLPPRPVAETADIWNNDRPRAENTAGKVRRRWKMLYNRDMTTPRKT